MAKILCLERGGLSPQIQYPPLYMETFPWTLSRETFQAAEVKSIHGSYPFFGGRSTLWSAWSPRPTLDLMRDFPISMKETANNEKFWEDASRLLNVTSASEIDDIIFASLQADIDERMKEGYKEVTTSTYSESARISVGRTSPTSTLRFNEFSVPGPLLDIFERQRILAKKEPLHGNPLEIASNCVVTRLARGDDGVVRSIETNRGTISCSRGNTKIILCAGVI